MGRVRPLLAVLAATLLTGRCAEVRVDVSDLQEMVDAATAMLEDVEAMQRIVDEVEALVKPEFATCSQDKKNLTEGTRVVRGPDWKWGDQDGNGEGTLREDRIGFGWARVKWDNGHTNSYRWGEEDKFDLKLIGCSPP